MSDLRPSKAKCVADDGHRAEAHRGCRDHRTQKNSEEWIKHARSDRNSDRVVDEGEEKVLTSVPNRRTAQTPRANDSPQIAFDQRDRSAFDRDVRTGSHRDPDVSLCERRRVVDAVARHRDDATLFLQQFHHVGFAVRQNVSDHMIEVFELLVAKRAAAVHPEMPIVLHAYDHVTPRNAPAGPGMGPWLYKAMNDLYGIPPDDRNALSDLMMDRLLALLQGLAQAHANVTLINAVGTLLRADAAATGESHDWENEIHPTESGYVKLASRWRQNSPAPRTDAARSSSSPPIRFWPGRWWRRPTCRRSAWPNFARPSMR